MAIPPRFARCHKRFGSGGGEWTLELPPGGNARPLFASEAWAQELMAAFAGAEPLAA